MKTLATSSSNLNVRRIEPLPTPGAVIAELPGTDAVIDSVRRSREEIRAVLNGVDDRLLVIVGPCSIHDPAAAREYAGRLAEQRRRLSDRLEIVMRVYFEKPRTTVGWKGLINDPDLDNSFNINKGLRTARELLLDINEMGLPAGTEYLDMITPQYIADLVAWGAIGARTTESQVHRELASGLSCPVGFKNGTDGNLRIALDAVKAASQPHHFLSVTKGGHSAIVATGGNQDCHVILRGGKAPNYDRASIEEACGQARAAGMACRFMVDASHGNSSKQYANQRVVIDDIAGQVEAGENRIFGVMIESHLVAGNQSLKPGAELVYGQSITDACVDWDTTIDLLDRLAAAVATRKRAAAA